MESVKKTLQEFGRRVTKGAKDNLRREKKFGKLGKSIRHYVREGRKGQFEFVMVMEDYGKFIDQGVKGKGGSRKYKDGVKLASPIPWKKKRVLTSSPFKYKTRMPPTRVFSNWSIRRGLAPRGKGGQFKARKSLQFALAKSVYHTGIETTHFLTKPFNKEIIVLEDELEKAFGVELEVSLDKRLKD